jgi:hypothetical protein
VSSGQEDTLTVDDAGQALDEVAFSLVDDGATPYRFAGAVSGGHPTSHVLAMFTPAAPAAVRRLEVASPLGRARFEFSR